MEYTSAASKLLLWITILIHLSWAQRPNNELFREYCEWESFNATCRKDQIILMKTAKYGRMKLGRCVTKNYGHIGCGTDVMPYMEERCSGRRHCLISVISLHNKRSCPKDFKSYLQAGYECLKVAYPENASCRKHGYVNLTALTGSIASFITHENAAGSHTCPWVIDVKPYQRINLTLVDFSSRAMTGMHNFDQGFRQSIRCDNEYAVIVDGHAGRNTTICGGKQKEANVYISHGNTIEIHIGGSRNGRNPLPAYFLLKYEAIGCPPIEPPYNAWVKADHDHAIIQCNETEEAWFLACEGTHWVGHVGNCSHVIVEDVDWAITDMFTGVSTFPFGLLIVVALGVAIGVAIGLVMLVSVLAYMKRRRRRRVRSRSNYLLKTISQENTENQCKANAESLTDCSPMLVKRDSFHSVASQKYCNTWQMKRPLPTPNPNALSREEKEDNAHNDDVISSEAVHTLSHTFPRGVKVFTTFKPPEHLEGYESPKSQHGEYFVTRNCDRDGPYYFKLDPSLAVSKEGDNGEGLKPDLVPGCLECQDRTHMVQHSVV